MEAFDLSVQLRQYRDMPNRCPSKSLLAKLPAGWQCELKRLRYARQIRRGTFATTEPEFAMLPELVRAGDWVLDVGANVGHYALRLSELVGAAGRVIAFEPTPTTFALLAANAQRFPWPNVTLINAAASDKAGMAGMSVPKFESGLANYYEAQLTSPERSELAVLTLAIDSLGLEQRVSLVKIDAEDHEFFVLRGMEQLIARHRPTLIVETGMDSVSDWLAARGYAAVKLPGSPNVLYRPARS